MDFKNFAKNNKSKQNSNTYKHANSSQNNGVTDDMKKEYNRLNNKTTEEQQKELYTRLFAEQQKGNMSKENVENLIAQLSPFLDEAGKKRLKDMLKEFGNDSE